jgi:hypothetical protein
MIFMSGGDQIPVMMVCDSKGIGARVHENTPIGTGHARDTGPPTLTGPFPSPHSGLDYSLTSTLFSV